MILNVLNPISQNYVSGRVSIKDVSDYLRIQGISGPPGAPGATGLTGNPGGPGAAGQPGGAGPVGATGPQGIQGQDGLQGPAGLGITIKGESNGTPSFSGTNPGDAYIDSNDSSKLYVWADDGQWIEVEFLMGPQGLEGPQGPIGADGPPGGDGQPGTAGAPGPTGPTGGPGPEGATGIQGVPGSVNVYSMKAGPNITLDPPEALINQSEVTISANINKVVAGTNVTLDPADGDLTASDVTINATASPINKILAGDRITLNPADGDLTNSNVLISVTGNTAAGVDVIYDPIFIDMEGPDYWTDRRKEFDYMGSEGIQDTDPAAAKPYMIKDVELSTVVEIPGIPADANGAFMEINFRGAHGPATTHSQNHPSYLLDCPTETYVLFKNVLEMTGGTFVSGEPDSMHNEMGLNFTGKLTPTTVMSGVHKVSDRQSKINFMEFTAGSKITVQTKVFVLRYHYSALGAGLGRIKFIPVKISNAPLALEWIKPQIEQEQFLVDGNENNLGDYAFNAKDVVRLQGNDLRQAVEQLTSAIEMKLAIGDGDANAIEQLRRDLYNNILNGSGSFETLRATLDVLKGTANTLGVIGLTKLEQDAGLNWIQPGNPAP